MAMTLCFNHDDRSAKFKCFDCKQDSLVLYCNECNTNIHALEVFRSHRSLPIEECKRRLSQDVSDVERLVAVESSILDDVVVKLRNYEKDEMEALHEFASKSHQRLELIHDCYRKVDKALLYLSKVSVAVNNLSSEPRSPSPLEEMSAGLADREQLPVSTAALSAPPSAPLGGTIANMKESYKVPVPGEEFPVSVVGSLNKNGCFWMIRKGEAEQMKVNDLESALREYFQTNPASAPEVTEGLICAARVLNRLQTWNFWRIRVEKIMQGGLVKIRYLDHGMMQDIPATCLIALPTEFKDIPCQALQSCLYPYADEVSLPYEAKWCFKDMTHNRELKAKIKAQVIPMNGQLVYYAQLTSVGAAAALNINNKIMKLVEEAKLAEEDRPIMPREPSKKVITESVATADSSTISKNAVVQETEARQEAHPSNATTELQSANAASQEKVQVGTPMEPQSGSQDKTPNVNSNPAEPLPKLLDVAGSKITILKNETQRTELSNQADTTSTLSESASNTEPQEFVPIGLVNEAMVDQISKKSLDNLPDRRILAIGRYIVVRPKHGNGHKMVIEAMKKDTWCILDDASKHAVYLNRLYEERYPVFVLVVNGGYVEGLAQMVSPVNVSLSHCSVVSPGILWGSHCRGEFSLKWLYIKGIAPKFLPDSVRKAVHLCKSYMELNWNKAFEVVQQFEYKVKAKSVLDAALRQFRQNVERPFRSSSEDLSSLENNMGRQKGRRGSGEPSELRLDLLANEQIVQDQKLEEGSKIDGSNSIVRTEDADVALSQEVSGSSTEVSPIDAKKDLLKYETGSSAEAPPKESSIEPSGTTSEGPIIEPCGTPRETLSQIPGEASGVPAKETSSSFPEEISQTGLSENDLAKMAKTILSEIAFKTHSQIKDESKEARKARRERPRDESVKGLRAELQSPEDWESDIPVSPRKVAAIYDSADQMNGNTSLGDEEAKGGGEPTMDDVTDTRNATETNIVSSSASEDVVGSSDEVVAQRGSPEGIEADSCIRSQEECTGRSDSVAAVDEAVVTSTTGSPTESSEDALTGDTGRTEPESLESSWVDIEAEQSDPPLVCKVQPTQRFYQAEAPTDSPEEAPSDSSSALRLRAEMDVKQPLGVKQPLSETMQFLGSYLASMQGNMQAAAATMEDDDVYGRLPQGLLEVDEEEDEDILPVVKGCKYKVLLKDSLSSDGYFWVRMYRDDGDNKEFINFLHRMRNHVEEKGEPVRNPHLLKFCCLYSNHHRVKDARVRRALITELLPNNMAMVRLYDMGHLVRVSLNELYELPESFQVEFPQQAIQCRFADGNRTEEDKNRYKELRDFGLPVVILVRNIISETAIVDIERFHQT